MNQKYELKNRLPVARQFGSYGKITAGGSVEVSYQDWLDAQHDPSWEAIPPHPVAEPPAVETQEEPPAVEVQEEASAAAAQEEAPAVEDLEKSPPPKSTSKRK